MSVTLITYDSLLKSLFLSLCLKTLQKLILKQTYNLCSLADIVVDNLSIVCSLNCLTLIYAGTSYLSVFNWELIFPMFFFCSIWFLTQDLTVQAGCPEFHDFSTSVF